MICKKCGHNTKEENEYKPKNVVTFNGRYWEEIEASGRPPWKNTKRVGKTKQYRLSKKIEELERKLKILT